MIYDIRSRLSEFKPTRVPCNFTITSGMYNIERRENGKKKKKIIIIINDSWKDRNDLLGSISVIDSRERDCCNLYCSYKLLTLMKCYYSFQGLPD